MKKILSVLLTWTIFLSSVSLGFTSFALESEDDTSLYVFADNLIKVIRENNVEKDSTKSEDVASATVLKVDRFLKSIKDDESIYDNLPEDAFLTKRRFSFAPDTRPQGFRSSASAR